MPTPKKSPLKKTPTPRRASSNAVSRWDIAAKTSLTLLALVVPLFVGSWTPDRWEIHKTAILLLGVLVAWLCFFLGRFQKPMAGWVWHPMDWMAMVIGAVAVIGTVTSMHPWFSLSGLQGAYAETSPVIVAMVSIYFLSPRLFTTSRDRFLVWSALLTGLGTSLLLLVLQLAGASVFTGDLANDQLFSTLSNSSLQTAILAGVIGTLSLLLWPKAKELWMRVGLAFVVALSWVVLVLLGQAVAWAIFALGMIIVVINQASRPTQTASRLVFVAVALAAVGMLAQFFDVAKYTSLPSTTEVNLSQTTSAETAWSSVWHRPVLGTGPNTWFDAFVRYRPESFNMDARWSGRYLRAGMEWAQTLATQGVVGFVGWLGMLALVGWEAWRRLQREASLTFMAGVFMVAALGLTFFLSTWSFMLLFVAWFSFGLLRAKIATGDETKPMRSWVAPLGFACAAIVAVVVLYPGTKIYASDVYLQRAQHELNQDAQPARVISLLETGYKLDHHNTDAGILLANAYLWKFQLDLQGNDITSAQQDLQLTQTTIRTVVSNDPKNPVPYEAENNILNNLASYLANPEAQANANFAALQQLEPASPIHDVGYGQTLLVIRARAAANASTTPVNDAVQAQRLTDAINAFTTALQKKSDYEQARYARAQAYLTAGDTAQALADAEVLTSTDPSNASLWSLTGQIYGAMDKLDLAKTNFEQALTLDSQDATIYAAYADALSTAKKTDEAKDVLNRGLKALPNDTTLTAALEALK